MGGGWSLQPEDPLRTHGTALAVDDHTLEEVHKALEIISLGSI